MPRFDGHSEKRESTRDRSEEMEKERKRRRFSAEYKAETVQLIQLTGKSIGR